MLTLVELFRLRGGIAESIDLVSNRQVKIRVKVDIPQTQYPTVNFVGKLLGPGGSTLRAVQESTKTKMAILGAGSLRDEAKERELLSNGDPKYQHLKQKLHLQVDSLAPPAEAYYRLSHALAELRKIMLPVSCVIKVTVISTRSPRSFHHLLGCLLDHLQWFLGAGDQCAGAVPLIREVALFRLLGLPHSVVAENRG